MVIRRGGSGNDTLFGTPADDALYGYGGQDRLFGRGGDDRLFGGIGDDRVYGEAGNDDLRGEDGADTLDAGAGVDTVFGGRGADTIYGRAGADVLVGTQADFVNDFAVDRIFGGDGDDGMNGGDRSADRFWGEGGDDYFFVNNDTATGGPGDDFFAVFLNEGRLTGGTGADRFTIDTGGEGRSDTSRENSVITDFSAQDVINVDYQGSGAYYFGQDLFDRLDADGNGRLTGADGTQVTDDGAELGVAQTTAALTLELGFDTIRLEGAEAIARADWA